MKKKKETAISPDKKELKKELKKKSSAMEKLKRELKIEAALEEVRARAMAMKKSEELKDVVTVVNERLRELGVSMKDRSASMIIFEEGSKDLIQWVASHEHESSSYFRTPYFDHPIFNDLLEAKEKGADFFYKTYAPEVKNSYFRYFFEHSDYKLLPDSTKKWILETEHYALSIAYTKNSALALVNLSGNPLSENDNDILKRFSRVFEQSYTRFLDLQKAEAQAREAQIELSLERVRAKTMAMHNSQDVANTVSAMFDELVKLGIDKTTRCGVAIIGKKDDMELWTASSKDNGQIGLDIGRVGLSIHPLMKGFHEAWKNKKTDYTYKLTGTSLKDYFSALNASAEYPVQFDLQTVPSKLAHSSFFFPEGALYAFSPEALTTEASKIFKRFAGVFGQTYRRFLDLQKAEEQVREAQIEAALERVRSKTMAMHNSNDLANAAGALFTELNRLGIKPIRTGFVLLTKDS
ncbi:MAG TPA: hypothetical protein VHZ50_10670, partial [Puia sp.]|nr:hypothetical protein [Puia sp.]